MNNYDLPRPHISTTLPFSVHCRPRNAAAQESVEEPNVIIDGLFPENVNWTAPGNVPVPHFNAFACETAFRIGLGSDVEFAFLSTVMQRLRIEAPNATLTTRAFDNRLASDGDITVSIGLSTTVQSDIRHERLRHVRSMLLRADTRPGELTLDDLCQRPHIGLSGSGNMEGYFDYSLRVLGRKRKTVLNVSQLHLIPSLLARTDMLAVVPDYVAGLMVAQGGLRADPVPLPVSTLDLSMAWHHDTDIDPAQQWLRSRLRVLLSEQ